MEIRYAELYNFIDRKVNNLLNSANESYVRATLAKLRRGTGKAPGSLPEIWEFTLSGLPEGFYSKEDKPSDEEWAAHMSLTLFALHQQGRETRTTPMSKAGKSLGGALRSLIYIRGEETEAAIKRRFDATITSDNPEELMHHLRGLIQLLKSESVPLDYPQLAEELLRFLNPLYRDGIRLKWGRDYYRKEREEENNEQ